MLWKCNDWRDIKWQLDTKCHMTQSVNWVKSFICSISRHSASLSFLFPSSQLKAQWIINSSSNNKRKDKLWDSDSKQLKNTDSCSLNTIIIWRKHLHLYVSIEHWKDSISHWYSLPFLFSSIQPEVKWIINSSSYKRKDELRNSGSKPHKST